MKGPRRRDVLAAGGLGLLAGCAARAPGMAGPAAVTPAAPLPPPIGPVDVDVHCHTFCAADLPLVGFVAHHIPGLADLSRRLTRWPEAVVRAVLAAVTALPNAAAPAGDVELAVLERALGGAFTVDPIPSLPGAFLEDLVARLERALPFSLGADIRQLLARYADTLYVVSHGRAALSATLAAAYPSVTLFTPSLVDYDAWSEDQAPTPLATQIRLHAAIARLSIQGKLGRPDARFHPFVAFDPRREAESPAPAPGAPGAALALVRQAVEASGFVGVKVYPPVGFAPLDNARLQPADPLAPRLDAALAGLYAYCQAEEVPITAHASVENEFALGTRELVAPARWAPALAAYPRLRLNFGHFGHDYGVPLGGDPRLGARAPGAWIAQAAALMQAYPNVYADVSGSPLVYDPVYAARFVPLLREVMAAYPRVKKRLMYGSDWWPSRLDPGAGGAQAATREALAACLGPDEVADVMGRNALRFLGFIDDAGRPLAGRAAGRLRAFHAGHPTPAWLA